MCTSTVDGVLIVREGTSRLRWAHERTGGPAPIHARDWQIAGLWPDDDERRRVRARIDRGEPVLVLLDRESPRVEFPVEHVAEVPRELVVDEDPVAETVTLQVPVLDWLDPAERRRATAFEEQARRAIARTPRHLLPPLMVEPGGASGDRTVVFALATRTGAGSSPVLAEVAGAIAATPRPGIVAPATGPAHRSATRPGDQPMPFPRRGSAPAAGVGRPAVAAAVPSLD